MDESEKLHEIRGTDAYWRLVAGARGVALGVATIVIGTVLATLISRNIPTWVILVFIAGFGLVFVGMVLFFTGTIGLRVAFGPDHLEQEEWGAMIRMTFADALAGRRVL